VVRIVSRRMGVQLVSHPHPVPPSPVGFFPPEIRSHFPSAFRVFLSSSVSSIIDGIISLSSTSTRLFLVVDGLRNYSSFRAVPVIEATRRGRVSRSRSPAISILRHVRPRAVERHVCTIMHRAGRAGEGGR
jgi:hypothetical protein